MTKEVLVKRHIEVLVLGLLRVEGRNLNLKKKKKRNIEKRKEKKKKRKEETRKLIKFAKGVSLSFLPSFVTLFPLRIYFLIDRQLPSNSVNESRDEAIRRLDIPNVNRTCVSHLK